MTAVKPELLEIIEPAVTALGYELVGCEINQNGKRSVLRVYVDGEGGISIDAITQISRQISAVLDVEEPISGRYELEVSSPGLDRPLYQLAHYQDVVGSKVKLRLRTPSGDEHRRNFTGILREIKDHQIRLELDDGNEINLDFDDIEKGNIVPEF